ncbi:MAG TPA: beta-L-arabinofuranosidase domain-containing protein [Steroidobacteraceae bacterium]|nr:beta-L-arabinofuranosidase domain-containing protein [Steroidobacteraceae bacterium]
MVDRPEFTRRRFVASAALLAAGAAAPHGALARALGSGGVPLLQPFGYGDVTLHSALHEQQLETHLQLLMSLDEDSLLKPFRQMVGQSAPGAALGGWYNYDTEHHGIDGAYAPSATFGQWVSALARMYAIRGTPEIRDRVLRLNRLYAQTVAGPYYENNRFPAYCYDKLVCGLIDSHTFAHDTEAFRILEHTTDTALPHLPGRAIANGTGWRPGKDDSYNSDESYTISENLFLAYHRGAGQRYRALGRTYLDDTYFNPLSAGRGDFAGRHAYSYINALSSAMQAYLTLGSTRHLQAARYGFELLGQQSFATGGWGPDETLRAPGSPDLYASLTNTHSSFETPCGSYAHFKITRYLLRVTGDARYGDSMERMMYNTVLGAKPILADGRTFYYADYNQNGRKLYSDRRWPCCSGTLPQVAADYRINTYLRAPRSVYVNLYIPSTLRWVQDGTPMTLTQRSGYPFDGTIAFELQTRKAVDFELALRIPAWAAGASLSVNGRRLDAAATPGRFARVSRSWNDGDHIELDLPLKARLEAIDEAHSDTVALLSGPLVLFPMVDRPPTVTRSQLLSVRKTGAQNWEAASEGGPVRLLPFTAIGDESYSTYLKVS